MDLETSLKKLFSLHTFGIKLGLDNTIGFLHYLGNPQNELRAIHIAGSNGKGSTSAFIASILQEFGFKIGLYTSPHFVKFNERIVINGKQINDEYVANFISIHEKYIDEHQLTFFEVTTAMAFQYFKEMKTDYCVIETGLGGRLDSTNVLNPLAVVITTISLEHTNVLGNTIEEIALEKVAIIKSHLKVFAGLLNSEAEKIVIAKCQESKSQLFLLKKFLVQEEKTKIRLNENKMFEINPPLKGDFQKLNASLAALVVAETFSIYDEKKFDAGIQNVLKNTGLSGRYEIYSESPKIIFDSAHNPEGIENFLTEFAKESNSYSKRILIFGAMRDKAIDEMLIKLSSHFDEILITEIQYERAAKPIDILETCNQLSINSRIITSPVNFIKDFKRKHSTECLVVLGSMYLLGEIKSRLQG